MLPEYAAKPTTLVQLSSLVDIARLVQELDGTQDGRRQYSQPALTPLRHAWKLAEPRSGRAWRLGIRDRVRVKYRQLEEELLSASQGGNEAHTTWLSTAALRGTGAGSDHIT